MALILEHLWCLHAAPSCLQEMEASGLGDARVRAEGLYVPAIVRPELSRVLDRMVRAQRVSETNWADDTQAGTDGAKADLRLREAVQLLAREWPEDYPAGAVEWLFENFAYQSRKTSSLQ